MYQKIVNPKTNRKVSVNSKIGKSIIKSYYNALVTGGSAQKDVVWNNPFNDPEVATKDWNQTKPKWFETEERMKKRNKPPNTPFNIQLKWLDKKPVTVKLIEASDSVEEVVLKWIAANVLPNNPEAADKIADKLHTFAYYYHPDGPGNGTPIPLVDGKKYDMDTR